MRKFPFYQQLDAMDCGATCLKMLAKHYGKNLSIESLREACYTGREGVSLLGISDAAESIGMHTLCARLSYDNLKSEAPLPCVVHWRVRHFLIVYKIKKGVVYAADPAFGLTTFSEEEFKKGWEQQHPGEDEEGFALFIEPTPKFYHANEEDLKEKRKAGLKYYLNYLLPYKKYYFQLFLSLTIATIIQIIFPFLTQSLVDVGVANQDIGFLYIVLFAQVSLFLSQKVGEFIRSWLLLHMTTRINLTILSDFLVKLMGLPISYFDRKTPGDIMQRIGDHERVQQFFTSSSVEFLFTVISILAFGSILAFYNTTIFLIYLIGSVLYFAWIIFFMKMRKELDYKKFDQAILNQNSTIQLVTGMQEIKLQNCETQKRWEWERIQVRFFKLGIKGLTIGQLEQTGSTLLNELKNILLTFYAANLVVKGEMTLGMMLATQYIVGQLNWITSGVITFLHSAQNAKLSADRLAEIHLLDDEEGKDVMARNEVLEERDLVFKDLTFQYGGPRSPKIINNFNLVIPKGKTTAIVGASGSGKTTLLKLVLKSYDPTSGSLNYGATNVKNISYKQWRRKFACVMQDSFIFSDTLAKNIAIGEDRIDVEKLKKATIAANIRDFIEQLPQEYNTKIGDDGIGLSQGQRQRVLLARAIYKNTEIILLDEATNALDANNEKVIVDNLNNYAVNKTMIVVAHRLSTVKNADQIVVLDNGQIAEIGTHKELLEHQGKYYNLVKNQLDLSGLEKDTFS